MNFLGLVLTVILFIIFSRLNLKFPIMISVGVSIILILKVFDIDYSIYNETASVLSFLIAPATIALAYPMYKNYHILLNNKRALYSSLFLATIVAIVSTYFCAKIFGADFRIIMSMLPKSTTMPIALEISKSIDGYQEITAVVVALTGVFGGVFGHKILKLLKIKNDVSIGLALGSASHVIGTAACAQRKKDRQTAASTIALILVGLMSAILIPMLKNLY